MFLFSLYFLFQVTEDVFNFCAAIRCAALGDGCANGVSMAVASMAALTGEGGWSMMAIRSNGCESGATTPSDANTKHAMTLDGGETPVEHGSRRDITVPPSPVRGTQVLNARRAVHGRETGGG